MLYSADKGWVDGFEFAFFLYYGQTCIFIMDLMIWYLSGPYDIEAVPVSYCKIQMQWLTFSLFLMDSSIWYLMDVIIF